MRKTILIGAAACGLLAVAGVACAADAVCMVRGWRPSESQPGGNSPNYVFTSEVFNADSVPLGSAAGRFGGYVRNRFGRDANGTPDLNLFNATCDVGDPEVSKQRYMDNARSDGGVLSVEERPTGWTP